MEIADFHNMMLSHVEKEVMTLLQTLMSNLHISVGSLFAMCFSHLVVGKFQASITLNLILKQ